ncbi:transposable element Tcb2 transposase [Trichonephila clavipes]|nr:transposable element Tcb2 transposase [Trichonephila clavipes]
MLVRIQQELLMTSLRHFQTLSWPARCPDLSPVEHVWDQLKRQMPSCHSVHDLELSVQELQAHLLQDTIRCLINSMPDRVAACIAAGVFGLITSVILISWICFGSLFSDYLYPTLPLEASGCSNTNRTVFVNSSVTCFDGVDCTLDDVRQEPFILYKMPYAWIPTIGTLTAVITIFIGSLFSGNL